MNKIVLIFYVFQSHLSVVGEFDVPNNQHFNQIKDKRRREILKVSQESSLSAALIKKVLKKTVLFTKNWLFCDSCRKCNWGHVWPFTADFYDSGGDVVMFCSCLQWDLVFNMSGIGSALSAVLKLCGILVNSQTISLRWLQNININDRPLFFYVHKQWWYCKEGIFEV